MPEETVRAARLRRVGSAAVALPYIGGPEGMTPVDTEMRQQQAEIMRAAAQVNLQREVVLQRQQRMAQMASRVNFQPRIPPGFDMSDREGRMAAMNATYNQVRRDMMSQIEEYRELSAGLASQNPADNIASASPARETEAVAPEVQRAFAMLNVLVESGGVSQEDAIRVGQTLVQRAGRSPEAQRHYAENIIAAAGTVQRQMEREGRHPLTEAPLRHHYPDPDQQAFYDAVLATRGNAMRRFGPQPPLPPVIAEPVREKCACFDNGKEGPCLCHISGRQRHIQL